MFTTEHWQHGNGTTATCLNQLRIQFRHGANHGSRTERWVNTLFMQSISANNRIVPSAFWFSSTVGLMFSLTGSSFFSVLWNKNFWVAMTLSDWSRWHHLYFLLILLTERNSYIFEKQKQKVIWRFVNPKFSVIRLHFTFTRHIVFKWIFWMFLIVAKF